MKRMSDLVGVLAAAVLVTAPVAFAADAVDLGTLGGSNSQGSAVAVGGKYAGTSATVNDAAQHAFLKSGNTLTDIGVLSGGVNSYGAGVNSIGSVAGYSEVDDAVLGFGQHAFLYSGGKLTDLGTLGGYNSQATGIDTAGKVVGYSLLADEATTHAFAYSGNKLTDLGTLPNGSNSQALGISICGVYAAGLSDIGVTDAFGNSVSHAALWNLSKSTPTITDLGSIGGSLTRALAVNGYGFVTGAGITPSGSVDALVSNAGKLEDIGTLGGTYATGTAINDYSVVVGFSNITGDSDVHAFIYTRSSGMVDLNTLLPHNSKWTELSAAYGIDDSGEITGTGIINGESHAFSLKLLHPDRID